MDLEAEGVIVKQTFPSLGRAERPSHLQLLNNIESMQSLATVTELLKDISGEKITSR